MPVSSPEDDLIERQKSQAIEHWLEQITPRERTALTMRYCGEKPYTLSMVGEALGVSGSRACQIIEKAERKLRHPSRCEGLRGAGWLPEKPPEMRFNASASRGACS
jgi:RNA polymerase primary sigma factor